jgi:hypothetical protein
MSKQMEPLSFLNKITVGLLILAIFPLPYSYYIFLRWTILISCSIHFYFAFNKRSIISMIVFAGIGILFNPIDPIYLTKSFWAAIDFFTAIFVVMGFEEIEQAKNPSNRDNM